jgi:hypothetical protein
MLAILIKAGVHPDLAKRIIFAAACNNEADWDEFVTNEPKLCWAPGLETVLLLGTEYSRTVLACGYNRNHHCIPSRRFVSRIDYFPNLRR